MDLGHMNVVLKWMYLYVGSLCRMWNVVLNLSIYMFVVDAWIVIICIMMCFLWFVLFFVVRSFFNFKYSFVSFSFSFLEFIYGVCGKMCCRGNYFFLS